MKIRDEFNSILNKNIKSVDIFYNNEYNYYRKELKTYFMFLIWCCL